MNTTNATLPTCYRCKTSPRATRGAYYCAPCADLFEQEKVAREAAERAKQAHYYWMPTKSYTLIDAVNRAAAATGSIGYAMAASHGDYNGHRTTMEWNAYNGYWLGHYTWAGSHRFARTSDMGAALAECVREWNRQGRGAVLVVQARTPEEAAACAAQGLVPWSPEAEAAHFATFADWRWTQVHAALSAERQGFPGCVAFLLALDPAKHDASTWYGAALEASRRR